MTDFDFLHSAWYAWIGRRVCIKEAHEGTLRYFGEISSCDGKWCGIELDESLGDSDGMINDERYFICKANHGIFVRIGDVQRLACGNDEITFPSDFVDFSLCKQLKLSKSSVASTNLNLNKTFDIQESKTFGKTYTAKQLSSELDKTIDITNLKTEDSPKKSSKDSSLDCLDSEESLGIITDILECSSPSDLLISNYFQRDHQNDDEFSVHQMLEMDNILPEIFSPANSNYYNILFQSDYAHSALENDEREAKCTSTPKQSSSNTETQYCDFLLQDTKQEPIIAGSGLTTSEVEFCEDGFGNDHILCSTSKILPSLLQSDPITSTKKLNVTYNNLDLEHKSTSNLSQGENLTETQSLSDIYLEESDELKRNEKNALHHIDVLNATFEVKSSTSDEVITYKSNLKLSPILSPNCNNMKDLVDPFDSPSAECDNTIQNLSCEKTFIVECSPIKRKVYFSYSKNGLDKQSLNTAFIERMKVETCQNLVTNHSGNAHVNHATSNLCEKSFASKNHFRKSVSLPITNFDFSLKNGTETSELLNTTFCIKKDEEMPKRYSIPSYCNKRYNVSTAHNSPKLNEFKKPLPVNSKLNIGKPQLKRSINARTDIGTSKFVSCNKTSKSSQNFSNHMGTHPVIQRNATTFITKEKSEDEIPIDSSIGLSKNIVKPKCIAFKPQVSKIKDGRKGSVDTNKNLNDVVKAEVAHLKKLELKEMNLTKMNKAKKGTNVKTVICQGAIEKVKTFDGTSDKNIDAFKNKKENAETRKHVTSKLPVKETRKAAKRESIPASMSSDKFLPESFNDRQKQSVSLNTNNLNDIVSNERAFFSSAPAELNLIGSQRYHAIENCPHKNIPKVTLCIADNKTKGSRHSTFNSKEIPSIECSTKKAYSKSIKKKTNRHSLLPSFKPRSSVNEINTNKASNVNKKMYSDVQEENGSRESVVAKESRRGSQPLKFETVTSEKVKENKRLLKISPSKENIQEESTLRTSVPSIKIDSNHLNKSPSDGILLKAERILMPIAENRMKEPKVEIPALKKASAYQQKLHSRKLQSPRSYSRKSLLPVPHL